MKEFDNIIISSRVRLARNIEGVPFNYRGGYIFDKKLDQVVQTILKNNPGFRLLNMKNLSAADSVALFEQHLISKELLENKQNGAVIVSPNRNVSIMLNEEDHVRIQAILAGSNLMNCYEIAKEIDEHIALENNVAFDYEFGFLTSCPTNLGTSMRASVMVFLPALTIFNKIGEIADNVAAMHLTIRGVYGEGSEGIGYMYQISNQASLGQSEHGIINSVLGMVAQICEYEIDLQQQMLLDMRNQITNDVCRAFGFLTNSHMLSTDEAVENAALVKLGVCLGILRFENPQIVDDIFIKVQPAILLTQNFKAAEVEERDIYRAVLVKQMLSLAKRI